MERLFHAIEVGNDHLGSAVAFSLEWANSADITMGWLECLAAFVARERVRPPGPAKDLPPLPSPGRGFVRDLPMTWERKVGEDEPIPESWEDAVETLTRQMRGAVETRWRGVLTFEEAFTLGGESFGHDIMHATMREAVVALRAKVIDLHRAMQPFETLELPELTGEEHEEASEYFDLAVLRGTADAKGPRERLWPSKRQEVEADEATHAAELRAEQGVELPCLCLMPWRRDSRGWADPNIPTLFPQSRPVLSRLPV